MTTRFGIVFFVLLASVALLDVRSKAMTAEHVTLAVQGRSNQTPWVAAHQSFVAITWARQPVGRRTYSSPSAVTAAPHSDHRFK